MSYVPNSLEERPPVCPVREPVLCSKPVHGDEIGLDKPTMPHDGFLPAFFPQLASLHGTNSRRQGTYMLWSFETPHTRRLHTLQLFLTVPSHRLRLCRHASSSQLQPVCHRWCISPRCPHAVPPRLQLLRSREIHP